MKDFLTFKEVFVNKKSIRWSSDALFSIHYYIYILYADVNIPVQTRIQRLQLVPRCSPHVIHPRHDVVDVINARIQRRIRRELYRTQERFDATVLSFQFSKLLVNDVYLVSEISKTQIVLGYA